MFYCYILFSEKLDRFYVGSTSWQPQERLHSHLTSYYGQSKFTAKTKDWELFYYIACHSKEQAHKIELHIKSMKSKTYIRNLIKYPEIAKKLLVKYR